MFIIRIGTVISIYLVENTLLVISLNQLAL